MKALDVISYVDKACNNTIDQDLKLKYLEWLDQQIARELIDTHEEAGNVIQEAGAYTAMTELLVPEPYAQLYFYYLQSKIHLALGETGRYQNMAVLYENAYGDYAKEYHRTHMPKHEIKVLKFT